jgi:SOS-response transcriptional repressor LexA
MAVMTVMTDAALKEWFRLSETRQAVLRFVRDYQARYKHRSPSLREIAAGVGLRSRSSVRDQLLMLETTGWIVRPQGRSIEIVRPMPGAPAGDVS